MINAKVRQLIVAPNFNQARLFCHQMNWAPRYVEVAVWPHHIIGRKLDEWEVWWLDRLWPCRTHEDVEHMLMMKRLLRERGADIHHWWT